MSSVKAALRYAKALLALVQDKEVALQVNDDMSLILNTVSQSVELQELLNSPVVHPEVMNKTLNALFPQVSKESSNLFATLVSNKRVDLLYHVASKYLALYAEANGDQTAVVTTAVALEGDLEVKVLDKLKSLTGKNVTVKNIIDESIIGGFILRVGDLQYNASVANQLNKLKKRIYIKLKALRFLTLKMYLNIKRWQK